MATKIFERISRADKAIQHLWSDEQQIDRNIGSRLYLVPGDIKILPKLEEGQTISATLFYQGKELMKKEGITGEFFFFDFPSFASYCVEFSSPIETEIKSKHTFTQPDVQAQRKTKWLSSFFDIPEDKISPETLEKAYADFCKEFLFDNIPGRKTFPHDEGGFGTIFPELAPGELMTAKLFLGGICIKNIENITGPFSFYDFPIVKMPLFFIDYEVSNSRDSKDSKDSIIFVPWSADIYNFAEE